MRIKIVAAMCLLLAGCSKGDNLGGESLVGYITIGCSVSSGVESRSEGGSDDEGGDKYTIPEALIPTSEEDFTLTIKGVSLDFEESYTSISEFNEERPMLHYGDYTATISNGVDGSVESPTGALFEGSASFTIEAHNYETQLTITATLQNSIIRLTATEYFEGYFGGGASLTLTTEGGSQLNFATPDNSLYEGEILFVPASTTLYLEGQGYRQDPTESSSASLSIFSKSEIGESLKGVMNTIVVDAEYAGASSLKIVLDDSTTTIYDETIELNPTNN